MTKQAFWQGFEKQSGINPITPKPTVEKILKRQVGHQGPVTDQTRLVEDLGFDSLDCVEAVMSAGEAFEIDPPDHVFDGVKTVGEFKRAVKRAQSMPKRQGARIRLQPVGQRTKKKGFFGRMF